MKFWISMSVVLLTAGVCYWFGRAIPFSDQWSLYEALRTTSAIVFGVMGAWIAIVFPSALENIFDKHYENKRQELKKIYRLLLPLTVSTLVLAALLALGVLAPMLKQIVVLRQHVDMVRGVSYALLGVLTLIQLWTLLLSLVPGEQLLFELTKQEGKDQMMKRLTSNQQKVK